jgi:phasin
MSDIAIEQANATPEAPPTTSSPSISAEMPASESPVFEFPPLFAGWSEKSAEQAKENWQVMKSAAEKLTAEAQGACSTAAKESVDYGMMMMDAARANTDAALELANALMAAKGPSEVIALSSVHARKQLNLIADQNQQLWAAAQKIASAMIEPVSGSKQ